MDATPIRDLAVIGNRRTIALVDRLGRILWYCPGRFDRPSLFAGLLDPDAGVWQVSGVDLEPAERYYIGESAVLKTLVRTPKGEWTFTDWMPLGEHWKPALCRELSPAPTAADVKISPRPDYAQAEPDLSVEGDTVVINGCHHLYASHTPWVEKGSIRYTIAAGESAWFVLADEPLHGVSQAQLTHWREQTLKRWDELHWQTRYSGIYEREVKDSLRALRLLTYEDNGGILASGTLGLPEALGGERNYDYRYIWLRDASMIVSALVRAGSEGTEERRYLGFLCKSYQRTDAKVPLPPFTTLDGEAAPPTKELLWRGYRGSHPVLMGNGAGQQVQIGGFANVLIAAKLIYNNYDTREHWDVAQGLADYLAQHWQEPDNGIWEEQAKRQYTTSKVISAVALDYIAEHADDPAQAKRWRAAAKDIRRFVAEHCITSDGAYAAVAGEEAVDVSAALFPSWGYTQADSPAMQATIARLERDYSHKGELYWRHLEEFDSRREGAFLAGTLWVAQYWVLREDFERAERILQAALEYANDLGLFAEEAQPKGQEMLGNFPQAFVHAALIGTVVDLKAARRNLED
jgi:GH15 family glucan-1,4-alpha-glucosidase